MQEPSKVEVARQNSHYPRGKLAKTLQSEASAFEGADVQLLLTWPSPPAGWAGRKSQDRVRTALTLMKETPC